MPDVQPVTPPAAVVMAAGRGTRMGSDLAKVLHPVAGRPMVAWVIDACRAAGCTRVVVVVGYQGQAVERAVCDAAGGEGLRFVEQAEQRGTGHAVMMAQPVLGDFSGEVFVLAGDGPLIRADTLRQLLTAHRSADAAATLATARLEDPAGYGRVLRDAQGGFDRIVEHKDATPQQQAVSEVNPSYYCFDGPALFETLPKLSASNAAGEYYITDVPGLLKQQGRAVAVVDAVPAEDVLSINTPEQLAQVDAILRERGVGGSTVSAGTGSHGASA